LPRLSDHSGRYATPDPPDHYHYIPHSCFLFILNPHPFHFLLSPLSRRPARGLSPPRFCSRRACLAKGGLAPAK